MRGFSANEVKGLTITHLSLRFHDPVDGVRDVLVSLWELLINDLIGLPLFTFLHPVEKLREQFP